MANSCHSSAQNKSSEYLLRKGFPRHYIHPNEARAVYRRMISGKNSPYPPDNLAAHAFHENLPPTKAHNLHSRTGLFRNAAYLLQRKKNESSTDRTRLLPTDEVHRTKRAPSLFRQLAKPLPASGVSIRQLQTPTLPALI